MIPSHHQRDEHQVSTDPAGPRPSLELRAFAWLGGERGREATGQEATPFFGCPRRERHPKAQSLYEVGGGAIQDRRCRSTVTWPDRHSLRHIYYPRRRRVGGRQREFAPETLPE